MFLRPFRIPPAGIMVGLLALSAGAHAQLTIPSVPTFPNEIKADVDLHLNTARIIAGGDNRSHFTRACIYAQLYPMYAATAQAPYRIPPAQIFDNLFWVGQGAVSAWAVRTSAGLVIIDSLIRTGTTPAGIQAETILVAGLRTLGLNPSDMKYLILTSEDEDHIGGAKYLQDTYGVQVLASDAAWNSMAQFPATSPTRNITITDRQLFTVGDTTFEFVLTPGQSPGAISMTFNVFDKTTRRVAALHSGFRIPAAAADKMTQIDSITRFGQIAQNAGVDSLLSSYQVEDLSLYGMDLLRHRRAFARVPRSASQMQDAHPFVKGSESYQRFLQVMSECVRVAAGRNGQVLPH